MRRGPALVVSQLGVVSARDRPTPLTTMDGDTEEADSRLDDLGEVGDRGLLDMIEGQRAAAARASRLLDGDLDGGLGELLGGRRLAPLEDPLAGLATGPLGILVRDPLENGAACRLPERVSSSTLACKAAIVAACLRIRATSSSRPSLVSSVSVMIRNLME